MINILDNDEPGFEPVETSTSQTDSSCSIFFFSIVPGENDEHEIEPSRTITNHAVVPCSILQPSNVPSRNDESSYELSGAQPTPSQMFLKEPDLTA